MLWSTSTIVAIFRFCGSVGVHYLLLLFHLVSYTRFYAFLAPKIIGGKYAPSPVCELGMVEMTQALDLIDVCYEKIGPDILVSGFLQSVPDLTPTIPSVDETSAMEPTVSPYESKITFFYKTWEPYGAFSNFSPHQIQMPDENGHYLSWSSVEHYYQAQKFAGVEDPIARSCIEDIKSAKSPEEAARMGRKRQRQHHNLVRSDWESVKLEVMYGALKCKFSIYPLKLGVALHGEGLNHLGRLLMQLRSEFLGVNVD